MTIVTLSTKGQLVIPREIREARGWSAGTKLELCVEAAGVTLREPGAAPKTDLRAGFGLLAPPPRRLDDAALSAAVDAMVAERWGGQ
jgi:AbrB family looped-hinge helix DNA binding protein